MRPARWTRGRVTRACAAAVLGLLVVRECASSLQGTARGAARSEDDAAPGEEKGEEGSLAYEEAAAIATLFLIVLTIVFEEGKHHAEENSNGEGLRIVVQALFGELTVLGFIGLIMFIATRRQLHLRDLSLWLFGEGEALQELVENLHMALFGVMMLFLSTHMSLVSQVRAMRKRWALWEDETLNEMYDHCLPGRAAVSPKQAPNSGASSTAATVRRSRLDKNAFRDLRERSLRRGHADDPYAAWSAPVDVGSCLHTADGGLLPERRAGDVSSPPGSPLAVSMRSESAGTGLKSSREPFDLERTDTVWVHAVDGTGVRVRKERSVDADGTVQLQQSPWLWVRLFKHHSGKACMPPAASGHTVGSTRVRLDPEDYDLWEEYRHGRVNTSEAPVCFAGTEMRYGELSEKFAPSFFLARRRRWPSIVHWYEAMCFADQESQDAICRQPSVECAMAEAKKRRKSGGRLQWWAELRSSKDEIVAEGSGTKVLTERGEQFRYGDVVLVRCGGSEQRRFEAARGGSHLQREADPAGSELCMYHRAHRNADWRIAKVKEVRADHVKVHLYPSLSDYVCWDTPEGRCKTDELPEGGSKVWCDRSLVEHCDAQRKAAERVILEGIWCQMRQNAHCRKALLSTGRRSLLYMVDPLVHPVDWGHHMTRIVRWGASPDSTEFKAIKEAWERERYQRTLNTKVRLEHAVRDWAISRSGHAPGVQRRIARGISSNLYNLHEQSHARILDPGDFARVKPAPPPRDWNVYGRLLMQVRELLRNDPGCYNQVDEWFDFPIFLAARAGEILVEFIELPLSAWGAVALAVPFWATLCAYSPPGVQILVLLLAQALLVIVSLSAISMLRRALAPLGPVRAEDGALAKESPKDIQKRVWCGRPGFVATLVQMFILFNNLLATLLVLLYYPVMFAKDSYVLPQQWLSKWAVLALGIAIPVYFVRACLPVITEELVFVTSAGGMFWTRQALIERVLRQRRVRMLLHMLRVLQDLGGVVLDVVTSEVDRVVQEAQQTVLAKGTWVLAEPEPHHIAVQKTPSLAASPRLGAASHGKWFSTPQVLGFPESLTLHLCECPVDLIANIEDPTEGNCSFVLNSSDDRYSALAHIPKWGRLSPESDLGNWPSAAGYCIPEGATKIRWAQKCVQAWAAQRMREDREYSALPTAVRDFVERGGFIFTDDQNQVLAVHAVTASHGHDMCFGQPRPWTHEKSDLLKEQHRWEALTLTELRKAGARHFCWISGSENAFYSEGGGAGFDAPYGAFVYIFHDPDDPDPGGKDIYFPLVASSDGSEGRSVRREHSAPRTKSLMEVRKEHALKEARKQAVEKLVEEKELAMGPAGSPGGAQATRAWELIFGFLDVEGAGDVPIRDLCQVLAKVVHVLDTDPHPHGDAGHGSRGHGHGHGHGGHAESITANGLCTALAKVVPQSASQCTPDDVIRVVQGVGVDYDGSGDYDYEEFCDLVKKLEVVQDPEKENAYLRGMWRLALVLGQASASDQSSAEVFEADHLNENQNMDCYGALTRPFGHLLRGLSILDVDDSGTLSFEEFFTFVRLARTIDPEHLKPVQTHHVAAQTDLMFDDPEVLSERGVGWAVSQEQHGPGGSG
eukprot:TRINITY_DN6014_c0_g1_i1.p1 TRINITY_DN6014_c0_g1~~TRINITY_DN6014_c0_g1_i1.p1  ORF type:complete len:1627 (+),score=386.24 TRINITY_DN6014_c0_g1_i1:86-4882(+)